MKLPILKRIRPEELEFLLRKATTVQFLHHSRGKSLSTFLGTTRLDKLPEHAKRKKKKVFKTRICFFNLMENKWESIPRNQNLFLISNYPETVTL